MTLDQLTHELSQLNETEREEVANYISYLRFRHRLSIAPSLQAAELATRYAEAADEDRQLAEAGLREYVEGLADEDRR